MAFQKIKKRSGFLRLAHSQAYSRHSSVVIQCDYTSKLPEKIPQVGYTASRRVGSAVKRNKAKRRLKAAIYDLYRSHLLVPENMDFVFIATPCTVDVDFSLLKNHILKGVKRCQSILESKKTHQKTEIQGETIK